MINTTQIKEKLNQIDWVDFLQEAIISSNKLEENLKEIKDIDKKIAILEQKKIRKKKNREICEKIEIKHNWLKSFLDVLNSDKKIEEKIKIIVESIHWMNDRIDLEGSKNTPFYCGDRALFLYQMFEENKEKLWIKEHTISLPYWHVMNIVKIWDKTYIVDAWAWCFNEITNNFKIQNKWKWEVITLNKPIKLYKNSNKSYWFTTFPTTKSLWDSEFLYTSINIQMFEYYVTNKLYEKARSMKWYENIESIEDLENFLKNVLFKKEKPYEWILSNWDVLLTFSKEQQIKMIEWQIYHRLSYKDTKKTLKDLENSSNEISKNNPDYEIKNRDDFLEEFYKNDKEVTSALNISDEDKEKIFQILKSNIKEGKGIEEIINILVEFYNGNNNSLLWEENEKLGNKLKSFLNALNLRANQSNTSLETELYNII